MQPIQYSNLDDIPIISEFYSHHVEKALNPKDRGKPMMDNRCDRGDPTYNPTIIEKGRVILPVNRRACHSSLKEINRKKTQKFRVSL